MRLIVGLASILQRRMVQKVLHLFGSPGEGETEAGGTGLQNQCLHTQGVLHCSSLYTPRRLLLVEV